MNAGERSEPAIREATRHSGPAIVTTSVALALGFLALMASAWHTIASFGLFVCLAIPGALASTVISLPAVLFSLEPRVWPEIANTTSRWTKPRVTRTQKTD